MTIFQLIGLLVALAALFGWVSSRWLRLPITIGTMLLTVVCSLGLSGTEALAPRLRPWAIGVVHQINFETLILHGMLALLLFAGAFLLDIEYLARERLTVGVLAALGTLLSMAAVTVLMWGALRVLGEPQPWLPCLFFGALISPTDPIAVLEMLQRVGISKNVEAQLAGESLFNDGVAAVLFLTLVDLAHGNHVTAFHVGWFLLLEAGGGLALGVAGAWVISHLQRAVNSYQVEILLTLSLAVGGYALADAWHLSAPLEAVAAAIALRHFNRGHARYEISHESVEEFWKLVDEVQNAVLFVLLGLEILAIPIGKDSLKSGLVAVVAVNAVRLGVVALVLWLIHRMKKDHESSLLALSWGGLRGGLSIALALSVPENQGQAWIVPTTYVVVVFSILVQGGSMDLILKRIHARKAAAAAAAGD